MSTTIGVSNSIHAPVRPVVNRTAAKGSPTKETHETPAKKAREQKTATRAAAPPASTREGVGQNINRKA